MDDLLVCPVVHNRITWDDICRMEIPVPEIGEQRKIVEAYKIVGSQSAGKRFPPLTMQRLSKLIIFQSLGSSERP